MRNKRSCLSPGVTAETVEDVSLLFCGICITASVIMENFGHFRLANVFLGVLGLGVFTGILSMIIKRLRRKYSSN